MGQSATQEECRNQYKGTQSPLVKRLTAPHPHPLWRPRRRRRVFKLESNSLLFIFCFLFVLFICLVFPLFCISVQYCFTPEMRCSNYSSKCWWLLVSLSWSVSVSVSARLSCLHPFPSSAFRLLCLPSLLHFVGSPFSSRHLWGVTELRPSQVVCLLLDGTALINLYPGSCTGHDSNIQHICSKVDVTPDPICLFPFTMTTFCAGRASQNWIYGYETLLFTLLYLKLLPRSFHSHTLLCHPPSKTNNWVSLDLSLFSCPLTWF